MQNLKSILLALASVVIFSMTIFGQNNGLSKDLSSKFKGFTLNKLNSKAVLNKVKAGGNITINADGKMLVLHLVENDLRAANYKQIIKTPAGDIEVPSSPDEITTFKGYVKGDTDSMVRLSLNGKKIEGLISTGNDSYFIEPARNYSSNATAEDFVVYREADYLNRKEISHSLAGKVKDEIRATNEKIISVIGLTQLNRYLIKIKNESAESN